MPSIFTTAGFQQVLLGLLPEGPIWPRDVDSMVYQIMGVLAPPYGRNAAAAVDLLVDAFPATTTDLLPEWEETLGLPDPCQGPNPTIQQRQAQVLARFVGLGGNSVSYFVDYAAYLGYPITITQFKPAVIGQLRVGQQLWGPAWAYAWQVDAPTAAPEYFRTEVAAVGETLQSFPNSTLQCELQAAAPAHTTLFFTY